MTAISRIIKKQTRPALTEDELKRLYRGIYECVAGADALPHGFATTMTPQEAEESLAEANAFCKRRDSDAVSFLVKDAMAAARMNLTGRNGKAVESLYRLAAHALVAAKRISGNDVAKEDNGND